MLHKASTHGTGGDALFIAFVANISGRILELDSTHEKVQVPIWLKDRKASAAVWFSQLSPEFQAQLRADMAPDIATWKHKNRLRK
jgi:hypothetical protein